MVPVLLAAAFLAPPPAAPRTTVDSRVVRFTMPVGDVSFSYIENAPGFTVKMQGRNTSVEAEKFYVGNGEDAVEVVAHPSKGIFLGGRPLPHGSTIKAESTVTMPPGHKKAVDLKPGDIYVTLLGVAFVPGKKE